MHRKEHNLKLEELSTPPNKISHMNKRNSSHEEESAVSLQEKEHLAWPLLLKVVPQLNVTKKKPPTLKIKQRKRRPAKHLLPMDKFDQVRENTILENYKLIYYKLISTKLI